MGAWCLRLSPGPPVVARQDRRDHLTGRASPPAPRAPRMVRDAFHHRPSPPDRRPVRRHRRGRRPRPPVPPGDRRRRRRPGPADRLVVALRPAGPPAGRRPGPGAPLVPAVRGLLRARPAAGRRGPGRGRPPPRFANKIGATVLGLAFAAHLGRAGRGRDGARDRGRGPGPAGRHHRPVRRLRAVQAGGAAAGSAPAPSAPSTWPRSGRPGRAAVVQFTHPLCSDCHELEERLAGGPQPLHTVDVSRRPTWPAATTWPWSRPPSGSPATGPCWSASPNRWAAPAGAGSRSRPRRCTPRPPRPACPPPARSRPAPATG